VRGRKKKRNVIIVYNSPVRLSVVRKSERERMRENRGSFSSLTVLNRQRGEKKKEKEKKDSPKGKKTHKIYRAVQDISQKEKRRVQRARRAPRHSRSHGHPLSKKKGGEEEARRARCNRRISYRASLEKGRREGDARNFLLWGEGEKRKKRILLLFAFVISR